MSEALNKLLQNTAIWRASSGGYEGKPGIPSDYPELDHRLPGSGWPRDGVTELLHDHRGIGELRLIAPALARLSREQERWIIWISPPSIPYAPALAAYHIDLTRVLIVKPGSAKDALWAAEKALVSRSCSAVLNWPGSIRDRDIRRLQVAAREGECWSILFRPTSAAQQASPAELRIQLQNSQSISGNSFIKASIIKRRGSWASGFFTVDLKDHLNRPTPILSDLILPETATRGTGEVTERLTGQLTGKLAEELDEELIENPQSKPHEVFIKNHHGTIEWR